MNIKDRSDVGLRVVEVEWPNGDRYYGKGRPRWVAARAWVARYVYGRRSR